MKPNKYATLALAGLISLYACDKSETKKPSAPPTIEQKIMESLQISDKELLEVYGRFSIEYQKKIDDALIDFAKRNGLSDVSEILGEDYINVHSSVITDAKKDSTTNKIIDLIDKKSLRLDVMSREEYGRIGKLKQENGFLYIKGKSPVPFFDDPELIIPLSYINHGLTSPAAISNPLIYPRTNGKMAVGYSVGWIPMEYLGAKPGPYAKKLLGKEFKEMQDIYHRLSIFIKKVKPGSTYEDLYPLVEREQDLVRDAVWGTIRPTGEGAPNLRYFEREPLNLTWDNLVLRKKDLEETILSLIKVLAAK